MPDLFPVGAEKPHEAEARESDNGGGQGGEGDEKVHALSLRSVTPEKQWQKRHI
jgi:hypothetical protein